MTSALTARQQLLAKTVIAIIQKNGLKFTSEPHDTDHTIRTR